MARALARGWADPVLCCDAGSGRAQALAQELGGAALDGPAAVAERADLIVLCHKPAQLEAVAAEVAPSGKPIASVLGGVTIADLQHAYPGVAIFRVMPNTPVEVRRGVSCLAFPADADPELQAEVLQLFGRVGVVVALEERLIGAAAAAMGVAPAYAALLVEAQVDAAVRYGLKPALASQLVVETMSGTGALLEARGYDTLAVRREVTSPGGTTAKGLAALERAGVRAAFQDAIDAVLGSERA